MSKVFGTLTCIGAWGGVALAQSTTLLSVNLAGIDGNSVSAGYPVISSDGRYVAFDSFASDLVPADTNATSDVFVRERELGVTERVSVSTSGDQGDAPSMFPALSPDGRYVAFASLASNLDSIDAPGRFDVFLRDRLLATTQLVSVSVTGGPADDRSVSADSTPAVSADGRFVAFVSFATNLVAGDNNNLPDVFVRDVQLGTTELVSVGVGGAGADSFSDSPWITPDGRFVAFSSNATNLTPGLDVNLFLSDVFLRDRLLGTTELISVSTAGQQTLGRSLHSPLSADARYVVFRCSGSLAPEDTNLIDDIYVRDRQLGKTTRVSVSSSGQQNISPCFDPAISADGRFISFWSIADTLVPNDLNILADVFLHDLLQSTTERVSVSTNFVESNGNSRQASISAGGRYVVFASEATNLAAGTLNIFSDVLLRDRAAPGLPFCFGDGSGTTCPCGNNGPPGAGCANSLGSGGMLVGSGYPALSQDTLVLVGSGMTDGAAIYFQGTTSTAGGSGIVFEDGLLCVNGTLIRLGTEMNIGGSSQYPGPGQPPISVNGFLAAPETRFYQVWYRDDAPLCLARPINLTNGWLTEWVP